MWNNQGGFMDGPQNGMGFADSPSQMASPSVQKEKKSSVPVSVTIKSIKECSGDTIRVADKEFNIVSLVGIIRSIDFSSTKVTFSIDDGTGVIQAIRWIESDSGSRKMDDYNFIENTYCKLFGPVRTQNNVKHVLIFSIRPLSDFNMLTTHLLDIIHGPLALKDIQNLLENKGGGMSSSVGNLDGSRHDQSTHPGDAGNMQGLTGPPKLVYQIIKMSSSGSGIAKSAILESLAGKVSPNTIDNVLEHLHDEGLIFNTVDEDHFKTSDNF